MPLFTLTTVINKVVLDIASAFSTDIFLQSLLPPLSKEEQFCRLPTGERLLFSVKDSWGQTGLILALDLIGLGFETSLQHYNTLAT